MYRKHFGLTQHPFSNEIEPEELFLATSYKELEVRLAHLIDMRGIGLVTGDRAEKLAAVVRSFTLCTPRSIACYTCACPPETSWTSTKPSPGRWDCC